MSVASDCSGCASDEPADYRTSPGGLCRLAVAGPSRPDTVGAHQCMEAALLDAIWHAWFHGDHATTEDLANVLRMSRSHTC